MNYDAFKKFIDAEDEYLLDNGWLKLEGESHAFRWQSPGEDPGMFSKTGAISVQRSVDRDACKHEKRAIE